MDFGINRSSGLVLLVVMLFLSILSVLTFSVLEISLLERKMSASYQDKVNSFYVAEELLQKAERQILTGAEVKNSKKIESNICGVTFHHLEVNANYHRARTVLRSIVAKVSDDTTCKQKPDIKPGRQAFWIE